VLKHITAPPMTFAKVIKDISDIIDLLRPIEASTKELCGQKYVTSSMVIPMVYMMVKKVSQFKPTQQLGNKLKKEILFHCEKRFGSIESVALLSIATVLDARFKKIYFKDPLALSNTYIADEIKQNQDLSESSSDNDTTGMETTRNKM